MSFGAVRQRFPRASLSLPGQDGPFTVEFIIDSAFDGELALPPHLARRLPVEVAGHQTLALADGTTIYSPYYRILLDWDGEERLVEVLLLDGNPLLGVNLWDGTLMHIEWTEGGEVGVEPL